MESRDVCLIRLTEKEGFNYSELKKEIAIAIGRGERERERERERDPLTEEERKRRRGSLLC